MSGRRCRALRRAFRAEHGRPPYKAKFIGNEQARVDEFRRVKKAYLRGAA